MSNNFMQHQFSMTNNQMGQLEPISNNLDSTIQMGGMGSVSSELVSQQMPTSNMQMASFDPGSQRLSLSNNQIAHLGSHQFVMPNMQLGGMESMLHNAGLQQLSAQKRKAPMEAMTNIRVPQEFSMPNKRMAQMEHRPWLQQMPAPNKKVVQMQSTPKSPGSLRSPSFNKKVVQLESVPSKSGPQQSSALKNQTSQMQSARARSESFESVRSKMRESLSAALALASQPQEKPINVDKNSQSESGKSPKEKVDNSQPAEPVSVAAYTVDHASEGSKDTTPSMQALSVQQNIDYHGVPQDCNPSQVSSGLQDFQPSVISVDEDISFSDAFFVKDELLQGNGLTWVLESEKVGAEKENSTTPDNEKVDLVELGGVKEEKSFQSPEDLAFKIESELFKLFGGVNKKYKEKGRSLLFNLKDRNNPELRERVMSGDITPERLCSMTAEELASKELSEWRIAKAEELAQMVVLQDSDVDVRRLVKKTHKGEFQVEVDHDDDISVEVSIGTSLLTRSQSQIKEMEAQTAQSPTKSKETEDQVNTGSEASNLQDDANQGTITIPSIEGSDLMQGLMADDEVKDSDLPPIVSLDEFMQSLDSEPPFENLKVETGKAALTADKDNLDAIKSSVPSPKGHIDTVADEPKKVDEKFDADQKTSDSNVKSDITPVGIPKGADVWEGLVQLNITSKASVVGYFKSGEKASAKDWLSFLEIKGRVRLDAFEKFLQDLRMSRSRAIMVLHFASKEGSAESELASIRELADSYVADDRVGFAEPAPGVELYFCPPHANTLEMLNKHLPKDYTEPLNGLDNGLVGVVVWRKGQLTSTLSPGHHKQHTKKQHHTSRRQQERNPNPNPSGKMPPSRTNLPANDDDEDDVPPGFGPGAPRDDDDLPEFNFSTQNPSRGSAYNPPGNTTSHPVEHIRQLIHKYGQPKDGQALGNPLDKRGAAGGRIQRWNDDDDDDIPEWQPQLAPPPEAVHSLQHQMLRPHMVHHQSNIGMSGHQPMLPLTTSVAMPMQPVQPQMNMIQGSQNGAPAWQQQQQPQGSWWVPQTGPPPNNGQFYAPRQDPPRRREF